MEKVIKTENPLVSVIMTCFNSESTLPDAISSLFFQTYKNWELIIVDDGSTDRSLEIVRGVSDERIKITELIRNYGRGHAYQVGLEACSGEFIMFLDSDDWWYSNKILKQINYMKSSPRTKILGSAMISAKNNMPIGIRGQINFNNIKLKGLESPNIGFGTVCMRKDLINVYHFDSKLHESQDLDLLQSICINEYHSNISEPLYVYNEFQSFHWNKIKKAWKNRIYSIGKFKRSYKFQYYYYYIIIQIKKLIYSIIFLLNLQNLILYQRLTRLNSKQKNMFTIEQKLLAQKKIELFN